MEGIKRRLIPLLQYDISSLAEWFDSSNAAP